MNATDAQLQALVDAVATSTKYREVSPELISAVGEKELRVRSSLKAAVKATKNKLHQVGGAYYGGTINYEEALAALRAAAGDPDHLRAVCRTVMWHHTSTRERLPVLDYFYAQTLGGLPPLESVLDLACGLNPLAWAWMPFGRDVRYLACDIYRDQMRFVQDFMNLAGIEGRAEVRDVLHDPPRQPVDLVFLLKTLPCLEQLEKSAASTVLDALQARYLLISYPVASLGGREKGMLANYEVHFERLAGGRPWQAQRFEFATELAFLVTVQA